MKIFLIHGDDSSKSQARLSRYVEKARNNGWNIVYIDEPNIVIKEVISSESLFFTERFFIHRDFKKLLKTDLDFISKNYKGYPGNLVLFSDSLVNKTSQKNLPKDIVVEEFKLPVLLWRFLESVYPGGLKNSLSILREILKSEPPELVLGLMARHLRDLYWVKIESGNSPFPIWRLDKLRFQSSKFKVDKLETLIYQLAEIDIKAKTSNNELTSLLDFVLISNLK